MTTTSPGNRDNHQENQMYQSFSVPYGGRFVVLRDGNVAGYGQPEPKFILRRYEHAQALREIQRENRVRAVLANESESFVERIRIALGIA